jgi:predicted acetyltransferase
MTDSDDERCAHLHVHVHLEGGVINLLERFLHKQDQLIQKVDIIMATQAEVQQILTDLGTQLDKAKGEIVQHVADLEAAIASQGNTTPEVDAALAALKTKVQALDDLNADAATA